MDHSDPILSGQKGYLLGEKPQSAFSVVKRQSKSRKSLEGWYSPIVTAGELGVKYPPLFKRAMRSVSPAFVIVAGREMGIVRTESMMWMSPPM